MSVIAVQSAVGNHVIDTQPAEARQALAAIEATSRSALTEMRRLLGVLRQEGEPRGSLTPAPGLADLSSLVRQVQDAGLTVWINVDGQRGAVPPGIDLSAYRIVQEALTNVIKHAAAAAASVTIRLPPRLGDRGGRRPGHGRASRRGSGEAARGTGSSACASGSRCSAGSSPPGPGLTAASGCGPVSRSRRCQVDPRRGGRRPGAGARRLPGARRLRAGPRGRRRGQRRHRGGRAGQEGAARRHPDGHPDAAPGRARGDPGDLRRRGDRGRQGAHPDHLRPGRVRLRRAAGGRQRVPAQGHPARRPAGRDPGRGGRRRAARAERDPPAHQRVRPPP